MDRPPEDVVRHLPAEVEVEPGAERSSRPTVQRRIAASRELYLTEGSTAPGGVRSPILASWHRSRGHGVRADTARPTFYPGPLVDSAVTRSADPVLQRLAQQLSGQSVSVVLTDAAGLVLRRLTGDSELERHLDQVELAPGFSYAERSIGTNGIGTALEAGTPTHVFGHEHYGEHLEGLACAAAPIRQPVTGRLVGAVDLTCWRRDAGALLLTLARATAHQIQQTLVDDLGAPQLALFTEYLRACHHHSGAVFALSDEVVMANDEARVLLDPDDQAVVVRYAREPSARPTATRTVDLPSGRVARLHHRTVFVNGAAVGRVAHVTVHDTVPLPAVRPAIRMPLPGLVGAAPPGGTCATRSRRSSGPAPGSPSRASPASARRPCSPRCSCAGSRSGG